MRDELSLGYALLVVFAIGLGNVLIFFVPLWGPLIVFRRLLPTPVRSQTAGMPKFSVTDGMVLFAHLAIANSLLALVRDETPMLWLMALALFTNLLVALFWIKCQQFLQKHQIEQEQSRLLLQAVLYPLSVIVVAEIMSALLIALESLEAFGDGFEIGLRKTLQEPFAVAAAICFAISIVALFAIRISFKRLIVFGVAPNESTSKSRQLR